MNDTLDHGPQPLETLIEKWNLTKHQLVDASPEQLNHKQVQKACKGRRLTLHLMQKLARSLNIAIWNTLTDPQKETYFEYQHRHLFNYAKGHDPAWIDPNEALLPTKN